MPSRESRLALTEASGSSSAWRARAMSRSSRATARIWSCTISASSSIRQSRPCRERAGPMLHHERLKPPSHDYPADEWNVIEKRFRPDFLAQSETMLALGNGYLGIRGGPEEGGPNAE